MLRPPHHHYFHTYSFIQQSCLLPLKIIGKHTFCIITPQNLNQNVHFHERPTLRQLKSSPLIPIEFFFSDNLFYIKQVEENSFIFFFAYRKKFVVLLRKQTNFLEGVWWQSQYLASKFEAKQNWGACTHRLVDLNFLTSFISSTSTVRLF